jgi:hypothetical protein
MRRGRAPSAGTGLGLADAPAWHVHRNAWIDLMGRIAQACLTAGKIALDVALLSQAEVGEMREADADAGGRSSAMPHKRNPAACAACSPRARRVPASSRACHAGALAEHERALGGWQAELATIPELADSLGTALDFPRGHPTSLRIDADRMGANLAPTARIRRGGMAAATDELLAGSPHNPDGGHRMSKADYDKGMKTRRKTLGDEWVDRALATQTPFNAEFQDMITRTCWNEIWNRPGLPHRERRMLVIAQTAALGRWEEFKLTRVRHCARATSARTT